MNIDWAEIYKYFNFIKNQNKQEISEFMFSNINNNSGWFLNRLGGSDYDAVFEYYDADKNIKTFNINLHIKKTKELNGYFDKSSNEEIQKQIFLNYLEKMYDCYINSSAFTNAVGLIQNNFNNKPLNNFNKILCKNKQIIHYYYIEGIVDFIQDFKIFAENKKILIVSPFSESIKYQTNIDRINNLIHNYTFPNCTFLTYNTPITYNSENSDLINEVTTDNWLEQCTKMECEISHIDFDIALLSCASYATCLGSFISTKMNKKSIYIGGILNVLFNIFGKRYDCTYYNNINNLLYRIIAFETKKYLTFKGGKSLKNESFNAYF
jgi:hypothetical protein